MSGPIVPSADDVLQVCVCGGGNSTHVVAGLAGARENITVNILDVMESEVAQFEEAFVETGNTLQVTHGDGKPNTVGKVNRVSSKAEDVVPGSQIIIIAVPAFVHQRYFEMVKPFVEPGTVVGVMVAQGGLDWCARSVFGDILPSITFWTMETLLWACRVNTYARIADIKGCKGEVNLTVLPDSNFDACRDLLLGLVGTPKLSPEGELSTELFPRLTHMANFLTGTLMNINSVFHPGISYGQFHDWDGETPYPQIFKFYAGADEFSIGIVDAISEEVLQIKAALLAHFPDLDLSMVTHVSEWLLRSYGEDIADKTDLRTRITTNKGYQGLTHNMLEVEGGFIPNVKDRYFVEDLPCGMSATRGIAEVMGVETPMIDKVLTWGQGMIQKEYLKDGKMAGKDIDETRAPQRYGLTTPDSLLTI